MIVVTGAAGLIGSAVVRELNQRGRKDILLVDSLGTSEKWMNLRSLQFYQYFEKQDFLDKIQRALQGQEIHECSNWEAIIHMGACSSTTEKDLSYLMQNNYHYSIQLARLAINQNIRMVYASSAATYGDGKLGFDDNIDQLESLRPLNAYGYSKHIFDLWMKEKQFQPNFLGIKYFNVFGPNEYHKGDMRSLVLKAFEQIQATGQLKLFKSYHPDYEDGKQKRDFLYVEDAARMTVYFASENKKSIGVVNAGSGIANTWLDMADAIFAAMQKKPKIQFIEMPPEIQSKYQYYTCAPLDRLGIYGYTKPQLSLQEAAYNYVSQYLLNDKAYA